METIALANGPGCEMQEPIFQFQTRRSGADLATLGFRRSVQGRAGGRRPVKPVLFPLHADCIQDNKCNAFNLGATRDLDRLVIARRGDAVILAATGSSAFGGRMNRYPMFNPQLLLSFVAICESNSFTRAAERVNLSQSTVSQQIRRLEEMLGKALFERSSHQVQLTEEGVKLLSYARRIIALNEEAHDALAGPWRDGVLRLGMPEDFMVPTADLLASFNSQHPHLRLDVTSGLSADLQLAYRDGELDLILVKQRRKQQPRAARPEPLLWLDSLVRPAIEQVPVPLAVFPLNGLYRDELCQALDTLGIRWRISYSSASLAALAAASAAGLGVSLLPASCRLPSHRVLGAAERLPSVDDFELALFYRDDAGPAALALAERLIEYCELRR
ncbi:MULTISPECIES: LysR family transcriptional regulator [unclassified Ensifer]|uniref:LysR family transcriptional regulator n=1 Tax=unclassified Ensifer TaxID=2633371 RepID=UPI003014E42A